MHACMHEIVHRRRHVYFERDVSTPRNVLAFAGVAVGCGWQSFVAYVNVACYYGVGIPLGCVLGFYFDLGAMVMKKSRTSLPFIIYSVQKPHLFYFSCVYFIVTSLYEPKITYISSLKLFYLFIYVRAGDMGWNDRRVICSNAHSYLRHTSC
jgi:hypothetical protein